MSRIDIIGQNGNDGLHYDAVPAKPINDRPVIRWRADPPPASEKIIYLTCHGVLSMGPVTRQEWEIGFVVCWQKCPKRPPDWDALLDVAVQRKGLPC